VVVEVVPFDVVEVREGGGVVRRRSRVVVGAARRVSFVVFIAFDVGREGRAEVGR